jgi:hypothetical protein
MFKYIEYSSKERWVHDTDFSDVSYWDGPACIIDVYWRRGFGYKDICKNLQLYYKGHSRQTRESCLENDIKYYGESYRLHRKDLIRYAPCLRRYIKKLKWIGK